MSQNIYKGIDVSSHQGVIDWGAVKADGIDFAIIRATYGWEDREKQVDAQFRNNVRGAQAAGMPIGFYHYSYAKTVEDAKKEAAFFLDTIKGIPVDYPVAFDIEDPSQKALDRDTLTEIVLAFCTAVEAAGYYVVLYSYKNWLETKLDMDRLSRFDVWLAHYTGSPDVKSGYTGPYGMWQYTSEGRVSGISGDVDRNRTTGYRDYPVYIGAKYEEEKPVETTPVVQYVPGGRVRVKGRLYASSDGSGAGKTVDGEYTVSRYLPGRAAALLIESGLGWVREEDCTPVAEAVAPAALREGAQVKYTGRVYGDSYGGGAGKTVDGVYTVDRYLPDRVCGVHLPAGWVPESACTVVG